MDDPRGRELAHHRAAGRRPAQRHRHLLFRSDARLRRRLHDPGHVAIAVGRLPGSRLRRPKAQLSWDGTWPIAAGQSLELEWNALRPDNHTLTSAALFCARNESDDGGTNFGTPGWDGGSCDTSSGYAAYNYADAAIFDIQATGTQLFTGIDNAVSVNLSFAFPFFGTTTTQI